MPQSARFAESCLFPYLCLSERILRVFTFGDVDALASAEGSGNFRLVVSAATIPAGMLGDKSPRANIAIAFSRASNEKSQPKAKRDLRLCVERTQFGIAVPTRNCLLRTEEGPTMGFLQRFFKNVLHEGARGNSSSFEQVNDDELETHLGVVRYGDFTLTDAVRPSYDLQVIPEQGYRHDVYHDEESHTRVPVIMAAASRDVLFDLFIELLEPLGFEVDVVLETSHSRQSGHVDLYREHIDAPVLKSTLYDFEDLLLNDGCTGLAVMNPRVPQEVQLDEHKLLIVYGEPLDDFEEILRHRGVERRDDIRFITEAEHVHSSSEKFFRKFESLKMRLGMDT